MHTDNQSKTDALLFMIGYSHQTAPLEVRERIALSQRENELFYQSRQHIPGLEECVLLNTCNRVEIYGVTNNQNIRNDIVNYLEKLHHMPMERLEEFSYWKTDLNVVKHAFEVASGLDSQMVGETEILGQVKAAYAAAAQQQATGPVINRILQKSFQAAKWARTHTGIGQGQISVGNVAVDLAKRVCGDLPEAKLLLIGTGEVGQQTAKALNSRGAHQITVASRTAERARDLANTLSAAASSFKHIESQLADADIVLCSTRTDTPIIEQKSLKHIIRQRPDRPLFIIDLGMPRNVDPKIARISNVYLYNLDNLADVANENLLARNNDIEYARAELIKKASYLWQKMNLSLKSKAG